MRRVNWPRMRTVPNQHEFFKLVRERIEAYEAFKMLGKTANADDHYWAKYKEKCEAIEIWPRKLRPK